MEVVRAQAKPSHGSVAFARSYNEGLGLDGGWGCKAPNQIRSVSRSRLPKDAQGMKAEWPRLQARFTTARSVEERPDSANRVRFVVSFDEEFEQPMCNKESKLTRTLKSVVDLETMDTISWEDLLNADDRAYNQIRRRATQSKQSGTARYVCAQCGFPVYAPLASNKRPYWKHFAGAPVDCPWWTGDPNSPDNVSAQQFGGQQEGALHHKIKYLLEEILLGDSEATDVAVEEYVLSKEGRRKPDVSAMYGGIRTAFEIQLATTQLPVILAKEAFYKSHGIRLVWVTWDFQHRPLAEIKQSFLDIYFSHDENLFSLDAQSVAVSTANKNLKLRAHAYRDNEWKSKLVSLREMSWNLNGLPFVYPKADPWHVEFEKRWVPCRKRGEFNYQQEKGLLLELSDRLNTDLSPDDWRSE